MLAGLFGPQAVSLLRNRGNRIVSLHSIFLHSERFRGAERLAVPAPARLLAAALCAFDSAQLLADFDVGSELAATGRLACFRVT